MGPGIIICLTLIIVVAIVCFTQYKLQINKTKNDLANELKHLSFGVDRSTQWLDNSWDDVIDLKRGLTEIMQKLNKEIK